MPTLSKKQRAAIETALQHLARAQNYLMQPDIAVGRLGSPATTTQHFTRPDGSTFYALAKDIGSDLVGLEFTRAALEGLLTNDTNTRALRAKRRAAKQEDEDEPDPAT